MQVMLVLSQQTFHLMINWKSVNHQKIVKNVHLQNLRNLQIFFFFFQTNNTSKNEWNITVTHHFCD